MIEGRPFRDLKDLGDEEFRAVTPDYLGYLGDRRAIEPLIKLLRDRRDDVVLQAVQALGKLGDARAVPGLTWLYWEVGEFDRFSDADQFLTVKSLPLA